MAALKPYAAWLSAILVALLSLIVYGLTLTPGLGLVDSGELTLAAWLPGNAHPPGSPFYVVLGYLFTHVPLGSVAVRLNVMSALWGAVASALVAVAVWLAIAPARPAATTAEPAGPRKPTGGRTGAAPERPVLDAL